MKIQIKCIIKFNHIPDKDKLTIVKALEPDNLNLGNKIRIDCSLKGGTLTYVLVNEKSLASGIHTLADLVRNINTALKVIRLKE